MNTLQAFTTSQKIKQALDRGYKKKVLVEATGLSFNTFQKRLQDNSWQSEDVARLRQLEII